MSQTSKLNDMPEVSFTEEVSLEQLQRQLQADYAQRLAELIGTETVTGIDTGALVLQSTALLLYQMQQQIEHTGKQNLLRYAEGNALDNVAALKNCVRLPARAAEVRLRFIINPQPNVVGIPKGTRAATAEGVYFATTEYVEVGADEESISVAAVATDVGKLGNGYPIGAVNVIVDPLPYLVSVSNETETAGGADRETDDELTARVFDAPGAYSVAGPLAAYEYHARNFRADVDDVRIYSPAPNQVVVLFLLDGGALPAESDLRAMEAHLSDESIRPLCDQVTAAAPAEDDYSIDMIYYVNRADRARAEAIQSAVMQAVEDYKAWQRKLGRDIDGGELEHRARAAGAKRVVLKEPAYTLVEQDRIARLRTEAVTYGGLEDD